MYPYISSGKDPITRTPADRCSAGKKSSTQTYGGFVTGYDEFDPAYFKMSRSEAANMDPQYRLLLELAEEAIHGVGGINDPRLKSRTGVFVGISSSDFASHTARSDNASAYLGTGTSHSMAAGRIAYHYGFHGPTKSIDTACSSSMTAFDEAVQTLRQNKCDVALVFGVNGIFTTDATNMFLQLNMLATDGRCKSFDAAANGYVRSEGGGCIVLQRRGYLYPLRRPLALVAGTAVNSDGKSARITAPNGKAQEAVIKLALQDADLEPFDIDIIEAHGTGTPIGDPIEVDALGGVFSATRELAYGPLMIGAVKSVVGHCQTATLRLPLAWLV